MPTKVEVSIRGLALCYLEANQWNVLFVCDPAHPLKLTDPSGGLAKDLRASGHDFICEFSAGQFVNRVPGPYPNSLFNLNGAQAHEGRLRKLRRNNFGTNTITMVIPYAELNVQQATGTDYWIEEVRNGSAPCQIGPVAKEIVAKFSFESDELTLRVGNSHKEVYNETFQGTGGTLKYNFNNHCGGNCMRNDSLDLYDVMIDGEPNNERRFVTGIRDNSGHVPGHHPIVADFAKDNLFTLPYGNCDPMASDPPIS